jgi:hypothetical protein
MNRLSVTLFEPNEGYSLARYRSSVSISTARGNAATLST